MTAKRKQTEGRSSVSRRELTRMAALLGSPALFSLLVEAQKNKPQPKKPMSKALAGDVERMRKLAAWVVWTTGRPASLLGKFGNGGISTQETELQIQKLFEKRNKELDFIRAVWRQVSEEYPPPGCPEEKEVKCIAKPC